MHDSEYQLTKNEFSSLGRGKYSGTTLYVTYACHFFYKYAVSLRPLFFLFDVNKNLLVFRICCCLDSDHRGLFVLSYMNTKNIADSILFMVFWFL